VKKLLLAALLATAVVPGRAVASTDPCQPYPSCCAFESNPWQCLGGEGPAGAKCAFNSTTDVTREAGWQVGEWRAGPLVTGESGSLECSITVNGVVQASVSAQATASLVVVIPPTTLAYPATAADDIQICTTWHGASGDLYWHGGNIASGQLGAWDASPGNCSVPTTLEPNDPECSIWKAVDRRAGTNIAELWQDCEPYDEFPLPI
jgi:hypothetical protein